MFNKNFLIIIILAIPNLMAMEDPVKERIYGEDDSEDENNKTLCINRDYDPQEKNDGRITLCGLMKNSKL